MKGYVVPCLQHLFPIGLLFALCGLLFFVGLADRDLWASHEGRAAQDAQSLLDDGFAGLPHLYDGRPELQKPPLYYWLVALLAQTKGGTVDAWAVRLPAALAGLMGVLGLYAFAAGRGRPIAGLVAAAALATAFHYAWLARTGRIDMPLTTTTGLALFGFFVRGRWLWGAYLTIALGLLFKGPIGGVLPTAVVGTWLLLRGELPLPWRGRAWGRLLHQLGAWWGVPLVLLLVVPVYAWADLQSDGAFSRVFLWHHNVHRGFGGSAALRGHPWWFYLPHLAGNFLPASLLLPVGLGQFVRRGWWRVDAEAAFGLVWLVVILLLLSLMRFKRADYLLPAFPGGALFLGCVAERVWLASTQKRRWTISFAVALGACVIGWHVYLHREIAAREPNREYLRFAAAVRDRAGPSAEIVFFRTESHTLAFHVGRPLSVLVRWEDLEARARQPQNTWVVMPARVGLEAVQELRSVRLEEVVRNTNLHGAAHHEKPLVLFRTQPNPGSTDP